LRRGWDVVFREGGGGVGECGLIGVSIITTDWCILTIVIMYIIRNLEMPEA
jgi:hypothetical protein